MQALQFRELLLEEFNGLERCDSQRSKVGELTQRLRDRDRDQEIQQQQEEIAKQQDLPQYDRDIRELVGGPRSVYGVTFPLLAV